MTGSFRTAVLVAVLAGLPGAGAAAEDEAARQAAERDMRGLGWLLQQGLRVRAVAAPQRPNEAQRAGIEQHAKQMERFFQPMLHAELELVRRSCGSLTPAARNQILKVGREAVAAAAGGMAERQLTGRLGSDPFDPREEIRKRLGEAVATQATPAELAAYRGEVERRSERRAEAARVAIVARVDRQLDLSREQRKAIEAELERRWQAEWVRDLDHRSVRINNNYPPAPDQMAAAIRPHLDAGQVAEWEEWCRAAGSRVVKLPFNLNLDGQGIQQLDSWWGK